MAKPLTRQGLQKKYGSGFASEIALTPESTLRIPTRIIPLNYQTNGGLPYGKILELFGEESTGKSLLAMEYGYITQQLGGIVLWNDAENGFDAHWFEANGLDLSKIVLFKSRTVEKISDWILEEGKYWRSVLTNNEPILFVQDSLAALDCLANIGSSQVDAKAEMGNRAKAIYKMLRLRNEEFEKWGISAIFINQLRRKVGATKWEDPDTTPGGAAMKFFAHQRICVARGKQIKKKIHGEEKRVGQLAFIRGKKDKTGPLREQTNTKVFFRKTKTNDVGFDRYEGLLDIAMAHGVFEKKKGASRYYLDGKMIANGEDNMKEVLANDADMRRKVIKKVKINTFSVTQEKITSINKNLYPVKHEKSKGSDEE